MNIDDANAVLFRGDDGILRFIKRENNQWNFESIYKFNDNVSGWDDLLSNPFEWVFVYIDNKNISTVTDNKTTAPEGITLLSLLRDINLFKSMIDADWKYHCSP